MGRAAHGCLGHPLCPVPSAHSAHGPGGHSYPDKGAPGTHTLCSLPTVPADVSRSLGGVVGPFVSHLVSGTQASLSGCRQHPHFPGGAAEMAAPSVPAGGATFSALPVDPGGAGGRGHRVRHPRCWAPHLPSLLSGPRRTAQDHRTWTAEPRP